MSVRITSQDDVVALYDSVTGTTFGEVFDNQDAAESFLKFLGDRDPRTIPANELSQLRYDWRYSDPWHAYNDDAALEDD